MIIQLQTYFLSGEAVLGCDKEDGSVTESGVRLLAAQKRNTEARLVERKVCFILDARSLGGVGGLLPKADPPPPH